MQTALRLRASLGLRCGFCGVFPAAAWRAFPAPIWCAFLSLA
jgi:hypothetical protein